MAPRDAERSPAPGITLVRSLRGHSAPVGRIAWSADGNRIVTPSADGTIRVWDVATGACLRTLDCRTPDEPPPDDKAIEVWSAALAPDGRTVYAGTNQGVIKRWDTTTWEPLPDLVGHAAKSGIMRLTFDREGQVLASASADTTTRLWHVESGEPLGALEGHSGIVYGVAFMPELRAIATGSWDDSVRIWDRDTCEVTRTLTGHSNDVNDVAYDPHTRMLASASDDRSIRVWRADTGDLLRVLEGHTSRAICLSFCADGRLLASRGSDDTVRLWRSHDGAQLVAIAEPSGGTALASLAFAPNGTTLATVGTDPKGVADTVVHLYEVDAATVLALAPSSVTYVSAKAVLVGDSGVGKTGLGWRLSHGEFKELPSTHGQQFWVLDQLAHTREDGTQCELVLWDLAGQPDYRLTHALFLDETDLALVLFDPTRYDDPLRGVEFWLKQLSGKGDVASRTAIILVGARADRGTGRLTNDEIAAFCRSRGIRTWVSTSAMTGQGVDTLLREMAQAIDWTRKPATVTTETFKQIKDYVLSLKETLRGRRVILTPAELRDELQRANPSLALSDADVTTSAGHLATHGYVSLLRTSHGGQRILLLPELLNNLAASIVLEARRNERGLGSIEEQKLLAGEYATPELNQLAGDERDVLLDAAVDVFLEHNVCFRETDPLNGRSYLVFPELINLKKPAVDDEVRTEDGVAYTVSGAVENVYASLVVLLGYTHTFTRTNQWQGHARYEVLGGLVCGFRLEAEREGELDFVLYFGVDVPERIRTLFRSLFESFLARRQVQVATFEAKVCPNGHRQNRAVVRDALRAGRDFLFCAECGARVSLGAEAPAPTQERERADDLAAQRRAANQRSRLEQAMYRLKSYVVEQEVTSPECFISYAWGDPEIERWVEKNLATDLLNAGVRVILDRWENSRIGASVPRFVERVANCDRVIVVGTPLYLRKYTNNEPMRQYVVAAEGDLIAGKMISSEAAKESVLPALLEGEEETSFPVLLRHRVYADFRDRANYHNAVFDLLLTLYGVPSHGGVGEELRTSVQEA